MLDTVWNTLSEIRNLVWATSITGLLLDFWTFFFGFWQVSRALRSSTAALRVLPGDAAGRCARYGTASAPMRRPPQRPTRKSHSPHAAHESQPCAIPRAVIRHDFSYQQLLIVTTAMLWSD